MSDDYHAVHAKRFQKSLGWIEPHAEAAQQILDIGGPSPFTKIINERWPGKLVSYQHGDLRRGFVVRDCDLILCMEVLEHVDDSETDEMRHQWEGTGSHMLLASCWMSLKPGGILFLTTPNACSITAIHHALSQKPPMLFRPHVREYAPFELDEMIRNAGFEILRRETLDVWRNAISPKEHAEIAEFIREAGYPAQLRGEDIFALCRRPVKTTRTS